MTSELSYAEFKKIFSENLEKRSRTAKGVSDTSTSSGKKKLLKEGKELKKLVEENTLVLARSVWLRGSLLRANAVVSGAEIRALMEAWDSVINFGLQDPDAYLPQYEKLCAEVAELNGKLGVLHKVNPRYRMWRVSYTKANLDPLQLEFAMEYFYKELSAKIISAKEGRLPQAELLAYADHMIDGEIHPWADGCGRSATAAVMWLSILSRDFILPVFGDRKEHYASIHDMAEHTKYFEKCLAQKR